MDRRGFVQSLLGGLCAAGALLGIAGCPKGEVQEDVNAPGTRMPDDGTGAKTETPEAGEATEAPAEAIDTVCAACNHEENRELADIPGKCSDCGEMTVYPSAKCPKCGTMNAVKEEGAEITCRVCKHKWTPSAE